MNASIARTGVLILAVLLSPLVGLAASPETMLREINRRGLKKPVVVARPLAGHYASSFGLTGDDLYLFPEGRYLYLEWGCLEPRTIHDRGWWSVRDGFVELASDGKLPSKDGPRDSRYLALVIGNATRSVMLLGAGWDYQYFCRHAAGSGGSGPDFMLTLCTKTRVEAIPPAGRSALYRKLMRESWRPAYFSPGE